MEHAVAMAHLMHNFSSFSWKSMCWRRCQVQWGICCMYSWKVSGGGGNAGGEIWVAGMEQQHVILSKS
eukprot:2768466-Ditylum_brightwellii.AAC.1